MANRDQTITARVTVTPGSIIDTADRLVAAVEAENARLRRAGTMLAEAALYVVREDDGVHRLAAAVSAWATALASEHGRGEGHGPDVGDPGLEMDEAPADLTPEAVKEAMAEALAKEARLFAAGVPPSERVARALRQLATARGKEAAQLRETSEKLAQHAELDAGDLRTLAAEVEGWGGRR